MVVVPSTHRQNLPLASVRSLSKSARERAFSAAVTPMGSVVQKSTPNGHTIKNSAAHRERELCFSRISGGGDESLLRNGVLHANRVAASSALRRRQGPSLPELRTPDENTQVGQRAPGLAAAAPLPPPLRHAACTTPVSARRLHVPPAPHLRRG